MSAALKRRLSALEQVLITDDNDTIRAIIVSVVDGRKDAPQRSDELECIGLVSDGQELHRLPGEPLADLDARAGALAGDGMVVKCWVRQYRA